MLYAICICVVQTYKPTPSQCDVLIVDDDYGNLYHDLYHVRYADNDATGRPGWIYDDTDYGGITKSIIRYDTTDGWVVDRTFNGIQTMYAIHKYISLIITHNLKICAMQIKYVYK